jgi:hypothetical protein
MRVKPSLEVWVLVQESEVWPALLVVENPQGAYGDLGGREDRSGDGEVPTPPAPSTWM